MQKILIFIFILSLNSFSINIPENIEKSIGEWIEKTYPTTSPIDTKGLSNKNLMYSKEIESYNWLEENVNSIEDKNIYKKIKHLYNPNIYGYTALKIIYSQEKKNL